MLASQPDKRAEGHSEQHHRRCEEAMMACQSAPRQQASCDGLHKPKTGNFRNISATFQKRQKRVNLEVECRHERGKTPGKTPKNRRSRMLVCGEEMKADGNQGRGQKHRSHRIPANRFLDYGCEPGVGNRIDRKSVVEGKSVEVGG